MINGEHGINDKWGTWKNTAFQVIFWWLWNIKTELGNWSNVWNHQFLRTTYWLPLSSFPSPIFLPPLTFALKAHFVHFFLGPWFYSKRQLDLSCYYLLRKVVVCAFVGYGSTTCPNNYFQCWSRWWRLLTGNRFCKDGMGGDEPFLFNSPMAYIEVVAYVGQLLPVSRIWWCCFQYNCSYMGHP